MEDLHGFLSSCFGSESAPNEQLLCKTIEAWVSVAGYSITKGQREWGSFTDQHNNLSWFQLRDTEHRRKYTAYFLSAIINFDNRVVANHMDLVIPAWLECLVDRDAMLKYEHTFTSAILNSHLAGKLVANLPFAASGSPPKYDISLHELPNSKAEPPRYRAL